MEVFLVAIFKKCMVMGCVWVFPFRGLSQTFWHMKMATIIPQGVLMCSPSASQIAFHSNKIWSDTSLKFSCYFSTSQELWKKFPINAFYKHFPSFPLHSKFSPLEILPSNVDGEIVNPGWQQGMPRAGNALRREEAIFPKSESCKLYHSSRSFSVEKPMADQFKRHGALMHSSALIKIWRFHMAGIVKTIPRLSHFFSSLFS